MRNMSESLWFDRKAQSRRRDQYVCDCREDDAGGSDR